MGQLIDYRSVAQASEVVFRNILRDMKANRGRLPGAACVPQDLETEIAIDAFFEKYSAGKRFGRFTITNFRRPSAVSAAITFEDIAYLSGGGAELEYLVKEDNSVVYQRPLRVVRSFK